MLFVEEVLSPHQYWHFCFSCRNRLGSPLFLVCVGKGCVHRVGARSMFSENGTERVPRG